MALSLRVSPFVKVTFHQLAEETREKRRNKTFWQLAEVLPNDVSDDERLILVQADRFRRSLDLSSQSIDLRLHARLAEQPVTLPRVQTNVLQGTADGRGKDLSRALLIDTERNAEDPFAFPHRGFGKFVQLGQRAEQRERSSGERDGGHSHRLVLGQLLGIAILTGQSKQFHQGLSRERERESSRGSGDPHSLLAVD